MSSNKWFAVLGLLSSVVLVGCSSVQEKEPAAAAMTSAQVDPMAQAPAMADQKVKTPLPPPTKGTPISTVPATGPYVAVLAGHSRPRNANFREDNPAAADCFLYVTATTCGGTLDNLGSSSVFGVAVGYRISPLFRVEIGYQHRGNFNLSGRDPAGTDYDPPVKSDSAMLSGFVDYPEKIGGWIQPFAGIGIGRAQNKMDALKWNDPGCCSGVFNGGNSNNATAWQLTLGAAISLSRGRVLDAAIRYTDLGEFKKAQGADQAGVFNASGTTTAATGKLRANEILLGLRYEFY